MAPIGCYWRRCSQHIMSTAPGSNTIDPVQSVFVCISTWQSTGELESSGPDQSASDILICDAFRYPSSSFHRPGPPVEMALERYHFFGCASRLGGGIFVSPFTLLSLNSTSFLFSSYLFGSLHPHTHKTARLVIRCFICVWRSERQRCGSLFTSSKLAGCSAD